MERVKEEWRDVIGYKGYYQVSNLGRVRSVDRIVRCKRQKLMKFKGKTLRIGSNNQYGHLKVNLYKKGIKRFVYVHQLVAAAWLGPCPKGQQVRHGLNGRSDNSVSNLCYGTRQDDCLDKRRDGTHLGKPVKRSDGIKFINMTVAAEETGCWRCNIGAACQGKIKTAGGYSWEYI